MKEKIKSLLKLPLGWLIISLLACLVCSFSAMVVNTAGFQVTVQKETVDIDALYEEEFGKTAFSTFRASEGEVNAKLTGYVYKPRNVSADNPAPCIVLTHGYLNSKEMQNAPAIEMARRGFVVFAFDQYDHGDSEWDTPSGFYFYVWSVYDAVSYMYTKDYVLKDANGNGMIAVSGHSMGGFSSEIAAAWDEIDANFFGQPFRKICAVLAVGADFRYVDMYINAYSGGLYPHTYNAYGTRSCGTIAAVFDEFFFNNSSNKTMIEKDYVSDSVGYGMLGLTKPGVKDTWYKVNPLTNVAYEGEDVPAGYGERIIYQPAGDHPYNTWSPEVTGYMIQFYEHAFTYQLGLHGLQGLDTYGVKTGKTTQVWWLREVFTCLGMIALICVMIFGVWTLVTLPFFHKVTTADADIPAVEEPSKTRKAIGTGVSLFSVVLSAYLIPFLMNRSGLGMELVTDLTSLLISVCVVVGIAALVIGIVLKIKGEVSDNAKKVLKRVVVGDLVLALICVIEKYVVNDGATTILANSSSWFAAAIPDALVYWGIAAGLLGVIFVLISHFVVNKDHTAAHLGLKANIKQVGVAFVTAVAVCLVAWVVLLISDALFNIDFRVYITAFNTATWTQFVQACHYMPLWFIFYLCAGIIIANATYGKKPLQSDLIAIGVEAGPVALFLLYQYFVLETTGTAPYPNFDLNSIVCQGLLVTLVVMAIIQSRTLQKTKNIWTGVFINTIFLTLTALASTCVYNLK